LLISLPNYEQIKLSIKEQLSRANYSTYQHSYIVRNKNTPVATPVYEYQTYSQANQSYQQNSPLIRKEVIRHTAPQHNTRFFV
jgi:hypothetical protein